VDLAQIYGYMAGGVVSVMLGLAHVLLNILSLALWLVSPLRVLPIRIANSVGQFMASHSHSTLLLVGYAIFTFIVLPLIVIVFF
jgi:hypothetical protein